MEKKDTISVLALVIAIVALILAGYSVMISEDEEAEEGENNAPSASITYAPTLSWYALMYGLVGSGEPEPVNNSFMFNASGSSDTDGAIVEYRWDFGDGSGGSGVFAEHIYFYSGTYTVTLTVYDDDGASDIETKTVTVTTYYSPPSNQTAPIGAFSFTESTNNPGNYTGSIISLSSELKYTDASVTIIDDSTSVAASQDPLQSGSLLQAGSGMTLTYTDTNGNMKIDPGDVWTISQGASGDNIKLIHKSGKIVAQYTLQ